MSEINTEQMLRDEFADRVKTTTLDELPALIEELIERNHDYGTICVAMGIAAAATAWAMNKHPNAGITGFQAGAIAWEFLRHWGALYPGDCGGRMQDYEHLLYPQYADRFTSISKEAWGMVTEKAKSNLAEKDGAHPSVVAHWQSIAAGQVPFGLTLSN